MGRRKSRSRERGRELKREAVGSSIDQETFDEACAELHLELRRDGLVPPSADMPFTVTPSAWRARVEEMVRAVLHVLVVGVVDDEELPREADRVG